MFPRMICLIVATGLSGCAHEHLRHNTVRQSRTLADIYEQQVLDNLAAFVANPHALPSFAYPKDGTANVTTRGSIFASPLDRFREVVGLSADRTELEQWGLTPVTDPDKLTLMRCAYQRAVGCVDEACVPCCQLEKQWNGKPDAKRLVYRPGTGEYLGADGAFHRPASGAPPTNLKAADGMPIFTEDGEPAYDAFGNQYLAEDGTLTVSQYDCNGACAIPCGWFHVGCWAEAPHDCCTPVGHYCDTYVWVDDCCRHELTKLVLTILDYATNNPPRAPLKTVTLYVDANGNAVKKSDAVGEVTADIAVSDPVSRILVAEPRRAAVKGVWESTFNAMGIGPPEEPSLEPSGPPTPLRPESFDFDGGFYPNQRRLRSLESLP